MAVIKTQNGTIYYEKNRNRWRCEYKVIDPNTSKERRKTKIFQTENEAKEFFSTLQYQKGNNLYIQNNGIPIILLIKSILERKFETGIISERTYSRTLDTIRTMEKCDLLSKNIDEITSDELQMYLNSLKHYSQNTIKKFVDQLNQAFKFAQNKGYIVRNPMFDVIKPKSSKQPHEVRALEIEEQQKLTDYLINIPIQNEPYKNVYLLQMFLGLRIGEALALQTKDINLHKKMINISKTLTTDKKRKVIMGDTTKTYAGRREIPIPDSLLDTIKFQMILAEQHKDKLLFVDSRNELSSPNNVNRRLKTITKSLGLESITTHSLRHTYGTRCIEAGMRAVALQRLMGHTDVSVTLNTYTSVFNRYKEQELEKVNKYYLDNDIIRKNLPELVEDDVYFSDTGFDRRKRILKELFLLEQDALKQGKLSLEEYNKKVKILRELSEKDDDTDYNGDYEQTTENIKNEYTTKQLLNIQNDEENNKDDEEKEH